MTFLVRVCLAATLALGVVLFYSSGAVAQQPPTDAQRLKDPNESVRVKAVRDIGRGDPATAIPLLSSVLHDPSTRVRREAVVAISKFQTPTELDPLIEASRDTDSSVRQLAVRGLVGYYTGQTPSLGFFAFWQRAWQTAKSRFVEENVHVDPGTQVDPKVIQALVAVMNDTRAPEAATEAADGLGILLAKSAVPDLVKAAASPDEKLSVEALNSLAKIKDSGAGPEILPLLDSSDSAIQQQAAVTLGILRTEQALPKLQSLYQNSSNKKTREKALEGLSYLGNPLSEEIFLKELWSNDKDNRRMAAEGLARAGDPKALADLQKAAQVEKDAEVRIAIQFAVTALGKDDYLSQLIGDLGSHSHGDSARSYLTELAYKHAFLAKLYPYASNQDPGVRRGICDVLMYAGDASSLDPLQRLTRDPNGDVAAEALRALKAVRARTGMA